VSDAVETGVTDQDEREDDEPIDAPVAIEVLEYLVKALVADPGGGGGGRHARGGRAGVNVHVGEGDMGRVIGKRGRVAQSIRTVVRAAAVRDGIDVEVEFVD
jgi:predicted RNA-binding protein YlqC (UPF0109 family)